MHKSIILTVTLTVGLAVEWCLAHIETRRLEATQTSDGQFAVADTIGRELTLDQLCSGALKIVDLTWPLNEKGSYWPGEDYKPFELRTLTTVQKNGVLSKAFSMPEHIKERISMPPIISRPIDPQSIRLP